MTSDADLSWILKTQYRPAETPEQLWLGFERLGRNIHHMIKSLPSELMDAETPLGLSPAWVLGHLTLLLRSVLEGFGGTAGKELPSGFATIFRAGGDGTEVEESPDSLIRLFDAHMGALCVFLRGVTSAQLSEAPPRDDFGLEKLMPVETLGGYGTAAIRYGGMYAIELAMLCEELS